MASKVAKFKTKAMVLGILVFQNSALALMMRYTRKSSNSEKVYAATTAVFTSEVIKFLVSVAVFSKDQKCGLFRGLAYLQDFIVSRPLELLKIAVPSGLYTVQNYLQYLAVSNLDGPTFQLLSQLKILTTAAFAVALLGKKLMKAQWVSLLLLVCGVGLVQLSVQARASAAASPAPAGGGATALLPRAAVVVVRVPAAGGGSSYLTGLAAVVAMCCTSGFAGVYFEKVLKGFDISLWMRNMQMALLGIVLGFFSCLANDFESIRLRGFFYGYGQSVWIVIFLQAFGGILVSLVVKYADNLLKGFATSLSIVLSCAVSRFALRDLALSSRFVVGAALILGASFLYGLGSFAPSHHDADSSPQKSGPVKPLKSTQNVQQQTMIGKDFVGATGSLRQVDNRLSNNNDEQAVEVAPGSQYLSFLTSHQRRRVGSHHGVEKLRGDVEEAGGGGMMNSSRGGLNGSRGGGLANPKERRKEGSTHHFQL